MAAAATGHRYPKGYAWYAFGLLIAAGIWELAALELGPYRLPSLGRVASQFFPLLTANAALSFQGAGDNGYLPHLVHTILYTLTGGTLGVAAGVVLGLFMARFQLLRSITELPIELLRTIPPLAAIPFVLIWIGPGNTSQLLMVSYYMFVMMVVTTLNAAANVEPILPTFAATLGANQTRIFSTVIVPAMMPTIVGGIRVAIGIAWSVQIVAELMGGRFGMGRAFAAMISFQALDAIVVGIAWLSLCAVAFDFILVIIIRRVTRWIPSVDTP